MCLVDLLVLLFFYDLFGCRNYLSVCYGFFDVETRNAEIFGGNDLKRLFDCFFPWIKRYRICLSIFKKINKRFRFDVLLYFFQEKKKKKNYFYIFCSVMVNTFSAGIDVLPNCYEGAK